ncbi:DNA utilization protein GntX [Bacteroidales bacterium Barb4]|nr:DNA utilization protein GntX [Bacteroidales bacterium Barb4]
MKKAWTNFLHLFFPNLCRLCGRPLVEGEEQLCLACLCDLPYTSFNARPDNPVLLRLIEHEKLSAADAFLYYEKEGKMQKLIHALKYHGNKELGYILGRQAARKMQAAANPLCHADLILPVPLHRRKQRQRGYNQSEQIARGLSSVLQIPVNTTALARTVMTKSQTRQSSIHDRWTNAEGTFTVVHPDELEGKHVLLTDDVITTGATVSACIKALSALPDIRISLFALSAVQG